MFDTWEHAAITELGEVERWLNERRDILRQQISMSMEPEQIQAILAAVWANGAVQSTVWRIQERLTKGVAAGL